MMASPEYTNEQLNYFRICSVATDIFPEGLRGIFKQEWDHRYTTTLGKWEDTAQNGQDFYNGESSSNRRRNALLLATMINGKRIEWDCTMLFYAILYSDCIGGLNPTVQASVDDLRRFRNEDFAHMPQGNLTDSEFQIAINKVDAAFQVLGLSTTKIQLITKQTSFPTKELDNTHKIVTKLKNENAKLDTEKQVLEDQLQKEAPSFCVLPPAPSHSTIRRDKEVSDSKELLHEMKEANDTYLSTLYFSGNPGSGKSQLARQVDEKWYNSVITDDGTAAFVMTLNAKNSDTLLESFVTFAQKLKLPECAVTNIISSSTTKAEDKIRYLKSLIINKLYLYTTWLLILDNVVDLSLPHLPHPGSEEWKGGQLIITTQDTSSIPPSCSFVTHVSKSRGMEPSDAASLLASISGVSDKEMEITVAKEFDNQPLALASAATYVTLLRESRASPSFEWNNYLKKLREGKRRLTEDHLARINPSYPLPMTAALTLAVGRTIEADDVMKQAFNLLCLCSSEPLRLDILQIYISNSNEDLDSEEIAIKLQQCTLLLFEYQEDYTCIRLHQAVHDVIRTVCATLPDVDREERAYKAVMSFCKFLKINLPRNWEHNHFSTGSKPLVPHLNTLVKELNQVFSKTCSFVTEHEDISMLFDWVTKLAQICEHHCCFYTALDFLVISLKQVGPEHVQVALIYNNLGKVYQKLGDLQQAKQHYERSLALYMKQLAPEHVYVATTYNNLGVLHNDLGEMQQAKQHYERSLAIRLKQLGPEHVDVATTYNNLGVLHNDLGDLQQAKQHYERSLAIYLEQLGPEHVAVATTYNNLGRLHNDLGNLQQAKQHYERSLTIYLKQLDPEHVDVAKTYNNLGRLHNDLGNLQQAKQHLKRSLAIRLKQLGPEHVDVAKTYNNLGRLHNNLGELQQAKQHYERSLSIYLKQLGSEHVYVATTYNNLGRLHNDLFDLQQAKQHYERSLSIYLKQLGPEDIHVATTYYNLGLLHNDLGDWQQAKQHLERSLAIRMKQLGPEHLHVATTYNKLEQVYLHLDDLRGAKQDHVHCCCKIV